HGFRMPWHKDGAAIHAPMNAESKRHYSGVNAVLLWAAAEEQQYSLGLWATFLQWKQLGAQVRKGEKATEVVFFKSFEVDDEKEESSEEKSTRLVARSFFVFNAAQVDGFTPGEFPELPEEKRIKSAEEFFSSLNLDVRYGGGRAFYHTKDDFIQMPEF